jgi:hypothetical protein
LDVRGVDFFSLQTPLKEGELESFPVRATLINLGPELTDFSETAAAIAQLDLVICVDTAVAHLAGALGKPVWVLLPEIGDFRWLEGREDSPWYPTMRLFRQRVLGEWDEVVARVEAALREAVKTGLTQLPDAATRASAPAAKFAPDIGAALLERTLSPEAETNCPSRGNAPWHHPIPSGRARARAIDRVVRRIPAALSWISCHDWFPPARMSSKQAAASANMHWRWRRWSEHLDTSLPMRATRSRDSACVKISRQTGPAGS